MKQCPVCRTTYTDESLRYCLADGSTLSSDIEDPTVFAGRKDALKVDIPDRVDAARLSPADTVDRKSSSGWLKAAIVFGIIGVVFIAVVGIMVAVLYMNTGGRNTNGKPASPTPVQTPTLDPEKQRLQDELANLQRKIEEQKNSNRLAGNAAPFPTQTQPGFVTARVNSPKDGFLALRDAPDSEYGERLAKIPHGASVTLNNCEKTKVIIDGRSGRWCQVEYAGQNGWVFDAWLDY